MVGSSTIPWPVSVGERSILGRKQATRTGAISFGYDPELRGVVETVRTQQPAAIAQRLVVEFGIFLTHVAPVASNMTLKELGGALAVLFKSLQCAGCGDDLQRSASGFGESFAILGLHTTTLEQFFHDWAVTFGL